MTITNYTCLDCNTKFNSCNCEVRCPNCKSFNCLTTKGLNKIKERERVTGGANGLVKTYII